MVLIEFFYNAVVIKLMLEDVGDILCTAFTGALPYPPPGGGYPRKLL